MHEYLLAYMSKYPIHVWCHNDRRVSDPLKLELYMVVNPQVGAGNWIQVFRKNSRLSSLAPKIWFNLVISSACLKPNSKHLWRCQSQGLHTVLINMANVVWPTILLSCLLLWQTPCQKQIRREKDLLGFYFQVTVHHWEKSGQELEAKKKKKNSPV